MPADGLPLSILVGGKDDLVAAGGGFLQPLDNGLFLDVLNEQRLETVLLMFSCVVGGGRCPVVRGREGRGGGGGGSGNAMDQHGKQQG